MLASAGEVRALGDPSAATGLPSRATLAWLFGLIRPYRARVVGLGLLSLAEVGLRALSPWPLKAVVDHVVGSQAAPPWLQAVLLPVSSDPRARTLATIVGIGLVVQLAHQVVLMLHTRLHVRIGQRMVFALRGRLFSHLQNLSLAHHNRTPRGDCVYRLDADATCIEHLLLKGLFPIAFSTITLVVMFSVLAHLDLQLALVAVGIAPALYVTMRLQARHMAPRAERTRALEAKVVARAYESFSTIRLVKGFAREPHELDRFAGAASAAMESRLHLTERESFYSLLINAVTVVGGLAVMTVGGLHVLDGSISAGTLLVVMAYLGYVYGPMTAIANTTGSIQKALASASRVEETLRLPTEGDADGVLAPRQVRGEVVFERVSFAYDGTSAAVADVSFAVRPGELVAVVGPSGAGKTTLVSLLTRFFEPSSGRVLLDGIDVRQYRLQALREQIGVVLQEGLLFSGSMMENIRYGRLDATDAEVRVAARAARADDFIERLPGGYQSEMAEAGGGLSGGERQRLSIARAFLKGAPVLILDEPTSSLDALSEARVLEALRTLRQGRTTFVIAHRLATVREADRILVLDRGRLVAEGTDAQLLATCALYRDMCRQLEPDRAA